MLQHAQFPVAKYWLDLSLRCSLLPSSHKARLMKQMGQLGLGRALSTASPLALLEGIARK